MTLLSYNNLTEFLLKYLSKYPGMYLGRNSIKLLPTFIVGFEIGLRLNGQNTDFYFEDSFIEWIERRYKYERASTWTFYFLKRCNEDEVKALELYFKDLEEYYLEYCEKNGVIPNYK